MHPPDVLPGSRRAVAVAATGQLAPTEAGALWACERFDGLLWQLVAMATSAEQCEDFLADSAR